MAPQPSTESSDNEENIDEDILPSPRMVVSNIIADDENFCPFVLPQPPTETNSWEEEDVDFSPSPPVELADQQEPISSFVCQGATPSPEPAQPEQKKNAELNIQQNTEDAKNPSFEPWPTQNVTLTIKLGKKPPRQPCTCIPASWLYWLSYSQSGNKRTVPLTGVLVVLVTLAVLAPSFVGIVMVALFLCFCFI